MVYSINYQGYGVLAETPRAISFRGEAVSPQNTAPSSYNAVQMPTQDVVQISAEDKKNNTSNAQKSGMSKGAKWTLGILGTAAAAYGAVVGHRMLTKPTIEKVAQNFSEIFRRDVSKEEAQKLVNNYKDLLNIKDSEEFCKRAFEQVKKDYGYENLGIKLEINYRPKIKFSTLFKDLKRGHEGGHWDRRSGTIAISAYAGGIRTKFEKETIIETLIHEFQHVKQTEYAYRTSPEKFFQAKIRFEANYILNSKEFKNIKESALKNGLSVEDVREIIEDARKSIEDKLIEDYNKRKNACTSILTDNLQSRVVSRIYETEETLKNLFGKYEKFKPDSQEYKLGEKYINNTANYINGFNDYDGYIAQILEKEAYTTDEKFDNIYKYFANPWRII